MARRVERARALVPGDRARLLLRRSIAGCGGTELARVARADSVLVAAR